MDFGGRKPPPETLAALIAHQVDDKSALDQHLGQRLGRKQMPPGAAGGEHDMGPPGTAEIEFQAF